MAVSAAWQLKKMHKKLIDPNKNSTKLQHAAILRGSSSATEINA